MAEVETQRSAALTVMRGSDPLRPAPETTSERDVPTIVPGSSTPRLLEEDHGLPTFALPPPPARDIAGSLLLDRYRLIKKLGEGGMGAVYLAEHVTIKKRCAIKVLNPEYAHKTDLVERFLQEARAASMIAHENVVEITDFGAAPNGSVFFVMEMLIGEDLADTIKREAPMPWSRVAPMALQICSALKAAHAKGIIHRDMKPENCFRIERSGNPDFIKVLDFGIAKVTTEDPEGTAGRLTSTGMIFGTPTYMSPEQAQGEKVDHRSDIYALGVILYELLTGKVPFSADNFMGILTKHMFDEPLAPSEIAPEANISPEVEALVLKALQKDRGYRFQSMQELAEAILDIGTGAVPVTVIPERRGRPISEGRPTAFLTRSTANLHGGEEVTLAEPPQTAQRRRLMTAFVLGLAVIGGGVTGAVLMSNDGPTQPLAIAAPGAAVEPGPSASAGETPPVVNVVVNPPVTNPPVTNPPVPPVVTAPTVFVISNVLAEVYDAADGHLLGTTGDRGFTIPGDGPRKALVRAVGYEDLEVELAPTDGQHFDAHLRPKKKLPGGKPGKPGKPDKPDPTATDPVPVEPKPSEPKPGNLGLKNPFETRGG
ncbi:MAG: serine/threonine protein kinase [Nannocystis sp.]|nr:serine/threonine-protein kinase [Nannocystis sp.]MBA3549175.1 serine/threonine protein kinase [Nannocystis sp.]